MRWRDSLLIVITHYILYFVYIFFQWFLQILQGPGLFFSSVIIFTQTVGLLGRVMSLSQGRCLYTGQ
jgi:hypothetical protein